MRPLPIPSQPPPRRPRGFTLIELIVTLSVLGILLTVGVPMLRPLMRGTNLRSAANRLTTALNYTRSEAVTRGRTVVICASDDPMANDPECSGETDWETGWLVFVPTEGDFLDADGDFDFDELEIDVLLRVNGPFSGGLDIDGPGAVAFSNMGVALAGEAEYIVCNPGLRGWDIRVAIGGRINNQRGAPCL